MPQRSRRRSPALVAAVAPGATFLPLLPAVPALAPVTRGASFDRFVRNMLGGMDCTPTMISENAPVQAYTAWRI
ncbi:hypothetical protein GCM10009530_40620 [Microbispora corallina]|uniref:Uncharacterized protein n=1 Tax=Microbispora corallina TaxID=83302 RepID=A0ABQ4GA46_9ACTN|nr:hypothetical protein [Microbispora corallina]GIH43920.1 hypothetical protein Mco01_69200 [Microbispora corallina]